MLHDEPPPLTDIQVQRVLRSWNVADDTCTDDPALYVFDIRDHVCTQAHCSEDLSSFSASMTGEQLFRVNSYISVLANEYPFQLRKACAISRYHRFLDVWRDTKSMRKAMRVI